MAFMDELSLSASPRLPLRDGLSALSPVAVIIRVRAKAWREETTLLLGQQAHAAVEVGTAREVEHGERELVQGVDLEREGGARRREMRRAVGTVEKWARRSIEKGGGRRWG